MRLIDQAIDADRHFRVRSDAYTPEDFDLPKARVFCIDENRGFVSYGLYDNIYEGLVDLSSNPPANCRTIGIETCGWAAPIPTDGEPATAPSESPDRRRVRMISIMDTNFNVASYVVFEDEQDKPMLDEQGEATGRLAEAMLHAMVAVNIRSILQRAD